MDNTETKKIVAKLLNDGMSLSDIQKELHEKHSITLTFLDLRLLAAELENVDWTKQEPVRPKEELKPDASGGKDAKPVDAELVDDGVAPEGGDDFDEELDEAGGATSGKTVVELSRLARPGAMFSGKVTFASGASADWVFDQLGRLGLEKAVGKPTNNDLREFQVELQKLLSRQGG